MGSSCQHGCARRTSPLHPAQQSGAGPRCERSAGAQFQGTPVSGAPRSRNPEKASSNVDRFLGLVAAVCNMIIGSSSSRFLHCVAAVGPLYLCLKWAAAGTRQTKAKSIITMQGPHCHAATLASSVPSFLFGLNSPGRVLGSRALVAFHCHQVCLACVCRVCLHSLLLTISSNVSMCVELLRFNDMLFDHARIFVCIFVCVHSSSSATSLMMP